MDFVHDQLATGRKIRVLTIIDTSVVSLQRSIRALASELGPRGITANAVAPGYTRTDANVAFRENPELVKAVEAEIALGRFGEPSEIAVVVAYLPSDEGYWVTGQTIDTSGGYNSDRAEKTEGEYYEVRNYRLRQDRPRSCQGVARNGFEVSVSAISHHFLVSFVRFW